MATAGAEWIGVVCIGVVVLVILVGIFSFRVQGARRASRGARPLYGTGWMVSSSVQRSRDEEADNPAPPYFPTMGTYDAGFYDQDGNFISKDMYDATQTSHPLGTESLTPEDTETTQPQDQHPSPQQDQHPSPQQDQPPSPQQDQPTSPQQDQSPYPLQDQYSYPLQDQSRSQVEYQPPSSPPPPAQQQKQKQRSPIQDLPPPRPAARRDSHSVEAPPYEGSTPGRAPPYTPEN